jgi:hypothetical protein
VTAIASSSGLIERGVKQVSRSTPLEFVQVYDVGDNLKNPPREVWSYRTAEDAVNRRAAQWRNHKRKLVRFPVAPPSKSQDSTSALGLADMEAAAGASDMSNQRRARIEEWNPARRTAVA